MTRQDNAWLFSPLLEDPMFNDVANSLQGPTVVNVHGLDDAQRVHWLCTLRKRLQRPLLVICPNDRMAQRVVEDEHAMSDGHSLFLPPRDVAFVHVAAASRELSLRRLEALGAFAEGRIDMLVTSADALMHRLMPRDAFLSHVIHVTTGQVLEPIQMMSQLVQAGYERVELVEARGQCAMRGGILDVYPIGMPNALRLEFFDDEVDSLRDFDVMTQRSMNQLTEATIYPASEWLLTRAAAKEAADRLLEIVERQPLSAENEDRQKQIEREYDLIPYEKFAEMAEEEADGASELPGNTIPWTAETPKKTPMAGKRPGLAPARSALHRHYASAIDSLKTGRALDGGETLISVLFPETQTLLSYRDDVIVVLDQPDRLRERCENRYLEYTEQFKIALERNEAFPEQASLLMTYDELLPAFDRHTCLTMMPFLRQDNDFPPKALFAVQGRGSTNYSGRLNELTNDLQKWKKEGWRIALFAGGVARGQRLHRSLFETGINVPFVEAMTAPLEPSVPVILPLSISRGFLYPDIRLVVVSESDIFGVGKQRTARKSHTGDKLSAFTDVTVGDYVVHESYGIGQYMGTVRLASEGTYRDFLHIRYQGSDRLYVPTDQLDRIQKYIGSEGEAPPLNRLSGGEWQRQKARVKSAIKEIAGDLIKLYAERSASTGYAFSPDTAWQRELEDAFPYEETPDQLKAIEEIKRDMEQPMVMDRLLCGDVGYGKTEVALRAIFKAVMDGKQAALLAPTTILVQQHYATMMNRFHGFPIRIDSISRFKSATEQKKTLQALKAGEIDVVVGTHRMLNRDVAFKDLGLLVIDEEQRFGVVHKEAIKKMKKNVDVLTLSATPIPRTLHMSMVGIRDMSILKTPPEERYPVQTYVVEYSDGLVRDAILRELSRGGQVYVLHNRVQSIELMYERIKKLVPEARIAVGHGQMREHALEDVMLDFYEGKFDVLLCTTIIEAGLDVPRANTLIICDADHFGLSQLYQLRGRVGRSNRLAYAYLTINPSKVLTADAEKRLSAIREFTEFGSGFRVAMRDLEIRGTGNLLGAEQSGHMASVGYDLYVKMIEETVKELRGDVSLGDVQTRIELKVDAYLPSEYVTSDGIRVEMYKKIASVDSMEAREDLIEELIDRFGDPAKPVMNLLDIAQLKSLCQRIGIDLVTGGRNGQVVMRFSSVADLDVLTLMNALQASDGALKLAPGDPPSLQYTPPKGKRTETPLRDVVERMTKLVEAIGV